MFEGLMKRVLRWLKNSLRQKFLFKGTQVDKLISRLDTDLSRPLVVGKGNVLYLTGWCYHPHKAIRHLDVLVDQVRYRVANHSMARPDILEAQALVDKAGHSLTSAVSC
jgi:hypothetical protein